MNILTKFINKGKIADLFICLFLSLIIFYTYSGLFKTFFQQDEWASLGVVLGNNNIVANLSNYSLLQLITGTERVLGSLINNIFDYYLPFRIWPFISFALFSHWINTSLFYFFLLRLTKNRIVSSISALVFCVLFTSSGSLTWIATGTTLLPDTTCILLSMHWYLNYLELHKGIWRYTAYLFFIVSLWFKESSLFMVLIYPLMDMLWTPKRKQAILLIKKHSPILLFIIFMVIVRYIGLTQLHREGSNGVFITRTQNVFYSLLFHSLTYPIISFSQLLIPNIWMYKTAGFIQTLLYDFLNQHPLVLAIQTIIVSDIISVWSSLLLFVFLGICYWCSKKNRNLLILGALYTLFSFLPYSAVDRPLSSYLESRYFYFGAIGMAIIFSSVLLIVQELIFKKKYVSVVIYVILLTVCFGYIGKNIQLIRRDITQNNYIAKDRRNFFIQLTNIIPQIPDKPIFYVTGDSPGFYGLANVMVPFQQGMGYTLMVWYYSSNKIPSSLLRNFFLWNINEEGYRAEQTKGFGYFWNKDDLIKEFRNHPELNPNQVVGIFYKGSTKEVINITDQIREQLL